MRKVSEKHRMKPTKFILGVFFLSILFQGLKGSEIAIGRLNAVSLPSPDFVGSMPLEEGLVRILPAENLSRAKLSLSELGQVLWAAQGITHWPLRSVPSAGATYPLEIYVSVNQNAVIGLEQGIYTYKPDNHGLILLNIEEARKELSLATNDEERDLVESAPVVLIILAEYSRTTGKYGTRGIRYVHLEVGHLIQNVYLQSTSLGISTKAIVLFNETKVTNILDTSFVPLTILPLGRTNSSENMKKTVEKRFSIKTESDPYTIRTVEQAIANRKSVREYFGGNISIDIFQRLLLASYGLRNPVTGNLSFPSITGSFPVSMIIAVAEVSGIKPGIYRYFHENNSFMELKLGDVRGQLYEHGLEQNMIKAAQINIGVSVQLNKVPSRFNEIQERVAQFEAGMCGQNLYLESTILGLGMVVVGAFNDIEFGLILEFTSEEAPLYLVPIGLATQALASPFIQSQPSTVYIWGSYFGLAALLFFFVSSFISTPIFKRLWKREAFWSHYTTATVFFTLGFIHVFLVQGFGLVLRAPLAISSYLDFIASVISIPLLPYYSLYDFGLILARVALVSSIFLLILILPLKRLETTLGRRRRFFIHRVMVILSIVLIVLHSYLNGVFTLLYFEIYTLLLILGGVAFFGIRFYSPKSVEIEKSDVS